MTNRTNPDMLRTAKLPACTMSELVYGPRRRPILSRRIAFRAALLGAVIGLVGCATAPRPVAAEVEAVGQLTASYASIATAPIHKSTDFAAPVVVDSGDDAGEVATTVSAVEVVEAPAVAPKGGLVVGEAR